MCVAVGLRRGTGVFARPRGSSLLRRVRRIVLLLLCRWLRLARPRGRFVVVLIRSYGVYCAYAPCLRKGAGATPSATYMRMM